MKYMKLGLILVGLLIIISLVVLTNGILETTTVRDVFLVPALVIIFALIFKIIKEEKNK